MRVVEAWKTIILRHVSKGAELSVAARLANVGMDRVIQARNRDTVFAQDLATAQEGKFKRVRI
jgi:hypothetical protein